MGTFIIIAICMWVVFRIIFPKKNTSSKDDLKPSAEWVVREFETGAAADSHLVRLKGGSDVLVAGFRIRAGKYIAKKLRAKKSVMKLVREPNNTHDKAAIAVHCSLKGRGKWRHIGYLPADLAGNIAAEFTDEIPLEMEVRRAGWKENSDAAFLAINVLVPKASERKAYLRN